MWLWAQANWEDALYALPEHLKKYQSKKNEEMLSNQMLVGIPEVDLGMELASPTLLSLPGTLKA